MNLLTVSRRAFESYQQVKGNENVDIKTASKKLTRNMMLAKVQYHSDTKTIYQYGSMRFEVKDDVVQWLTNGNSFSDWELDKKEYVRLSRELGIDENVTVMGLYIREVKGNLRYWKNKIKWKLIKLAEVVRGVF